MGNVGLWYNGQIIDGLTIPASCTAYLSLPDTATLAQAVSGLGVWAAAVDGCVDGAFTQVTATLTPALPGGLKAPTGPTWAASQASKTGIIDFSATGTTRRWGFALPTLSTAVIAGGHIDLTNPNITALISLLLTPGGFFTNPDKQALEAALDALITFRKYSQLRKRSMVVE